MTWSPDPNALRGRVAVVAGATRGAGRGIAAALGEAGATVICTGRSTRAQGSSRSDYNRPETIEETAELVTRLGGSGIAIAVDHLESSQVKRLADDLRQTYGHMEHDLDKGLRILRLGIDTHLITAHHLLPLVVSQAGGLLVEVTDGTFEYNAAHYRLSAFYDLAKISVNRLAFSLGHEMAPHAATAVSMTPGWLRSEMMLENYGVSEERWRDALAPTASPQAPPGFAVSESPRYVGRAVAALAADPDRHRWNQRSVTSGQLAATYGFTDVDGSRPHVWQYNDDVEAGLNPDPENYR